MTYELALLWMLTETLFLFLREVQEELLKIAREKAAKEICLALIEEGVLHELREVAGDALEEEKAERDAKLQQLASLVIRKRTSRYFKRCSMSDSPTFLNYKLRLCS